ncbi:hypothetical protein KKD20_01145 [Patescibacteria group bacterium]|nr:hypothetical protein [Patescibacteria group bacterium]
MTQSYLSPILQDKYQWQEQEYKRTRNMTTSQYLNYVQSEAERVITAAGYRKMKLGPYCFKIVTRSMSKK